MPPPLFKQGTCLSSVAPEHRLEEERQPAFPPAIPVATRGRAWYFSLGCCPSFIHHHSLSSSPPRRKFNPLAHTHLVNFSVPVCHCHHGNSPQRWPGSSAAAGRQPLPAFSALRSLLLLQISSGSVGRQRAMPAPGPPSRAPSFLPDMFARGVVVLLNCLCLHSHNACSFLRDISRLSFRDSDRITPTTAPQREVLPLLPCV